MRLSSPGRHDASPKWRKIMGYKTILACLSSVQAVPALIAAARELGAHFGAHIQGLYVVPGVTVYSGTEFGAVAQVNDTVRRHYEKHLDDVRKTFSDAMTKDGLNFDFQTVDANVPNTTAEFLNNAKSADLVMVSPAGDANVSGVEPDFPERMVMGCGRPVLVLTGGEIGGRIMGDIMLAWNDSRESARAAFDAIPFMQAAKRTQVATIGPYRGIVHGAAIAESLDRQGINVETLSLSADGMGEGEVLLRAARDHGAGLLVMGCYGHSRLREMVFGGVSRHVFKNAGLPVLMSH
jgi:nucleotide-binding universal stress UspA family protein